jgi:indole-3-glycerol phosphate synthase
MAAARQAVQGFPCAVLRKDFLVDPYQLLEARVHGADAVLLIAAILDDAAFQELFEGALTLGLTPLVEVHSREELERVLPFGPPVIGINNRDLTTFDVDVATTERLRPLIPPGHTVISESGIHGPAQMRALAQLGVDAVLVGESLVTATDPAVKLKELKEAGR